MINELVLASGNKGKLSEMQALLAPAGISVEPMSLYTEQSPEETGLSFVENAIIKARHVAAVSGKAALADDSGLEVDALSGRPGIYSARFAGAHASDSDNNALLLELMEDVETERRSARYHCVMVLMRTPSDPMPLICSASWEGQILYAPQGNNGFGYDPLFYVPDLQCSAAELDKAHKNRISHRAKALRALMSTLGLATD